MKTINLLGIAGDDGAHTDESLIICGTAKLDIKKSYEGMEALDITLSDGAAKSLKPGLT